MRTTLVIDDELLVSAKKLAAERGTSVSAVVGEALRRFVHGRDRPAGQARFVTPTFGGGPQAKVVDSTPDEFRQLESDSELRPFER